MQEGFRVVMGKDAVTALQTGVITALGHQVNLEGVMGAGIERQIRRACPPACVAYRDAIQGRQLALGDILPIEVAPGRWVVHAVGQVSGEVKLLTSSCPETPNSRQTDERRKEFCFHITEVTLLTCWALEVKLLT